jgi:exosortase/archaeosortase family protein
MWDLFAQASWRVALVSLLLGVGLPALFAVGVRQTVLATTDGSGGPPHAAGMHRVLGWVCFALVVAAVLVGLTIIVASGLGKQVSFEHVVPTIVDKS